MATMDRTSKTDVLQIRTVADILEDWRRQNEQIAQAQLAHMNMTPEERRAAEEKVAARQGGHRVYNVKDLVAAHEESAAASLLPAGYYAIDLEA